MVAVLLVGTATRLLACFLWSEDLTLDRDAYLGIARNIAAGNGFCTPATTTPTAYRPPVYPISLGMLFTVMPERIAVTVLNIAAGLASICGVWILTKQWWQPSLRQRLVAGLAIALDPLLLRYTAQPMTECVFTALTVWTLVGLSSLSRQSHDRQGVSSSSAQLGTRSLTVAALTPALTGLLTGLAVLCRPTLLPFVGLMTGLLFGRAVWRNPAGWKVPARFAVGWLILIALWAGRNQIVMGHPILTTTHGGYTLLLGNNPVFYNDVARKPWGTVWSHDSLVRWQAALAENMRHDLGEHISEVAADRWHVRQATHAMHDDPDGFHAAVLYRVRSFWSLTPRGPEATSGWLTISVAVWYAALFVLATIGFGFAVIRRHPAALFAGLLIATVAVLHLFYWADTRMRAPLHPVFVTLAVGVFSLRSRAMAMAMAMASR